MRFGSRTSGVAFSVLATAAFTLIGPLAESAPAQLSPNGIDFQVNTYTTGQQWGSSVAGLGSSGFVVVWASDGSGGSDTDGLSVQAQRIGLDGALLGQQFQINATTPGSQSRPRVASDGASNFIVVWESASSAGTDTSGTSIQGRRFSSSGVPLGDEFQVNTLTENWQQTPAIAAARGGEFVVVWGSTMGDSWPTRNIQAQRLSATAEPLGGEFQVDSFTGSTYTISPDIAALDEGGFAVTWRSGGSPGNDHEYSSIQARVYDANAEPLAPQLQVNTRVFDRQMSPSVASLSGGDFVVAWWSYQWGTCHTCYATELYMQRFDSAGGTLGGESQIDQFTEGRVRPRVKGAPSGDFVVAWTSHGLYLPSVANVQARRFGVDGTPRTAHFQVNSYTTLSQGEPSLAFDDSGNFLVAWTSEASPGTDSSSTSIVARRVADLFRDGFETGGLIRWSSTAP